MNLIRFGPPGEERPGLILPDGRRIDASGFGADYDQLFFESDGLARLARWGARAGAAAPRPVPDGARLGPPLCRPSKIVCIGLNYRDHARETGQEVPKEPVIFFKANSETKRCSSTRELVFDVPTLVSYISQFMTLLPGDIISTGTPAGVGLGQRPPRYLAAGDEVELGIDGLGSARQRVRAYHEGLEVRDSGHRIP